jgi:Endonuclease/Exonuclease/phosphatase family
MAALVMAAGAAIVLTASPPQVTAARPALRITQFNLCDSGIAPCYTGRAVAAAAALLHADAPDVVTLNEVCESDVASLAGALTAARAGSTVESAFQPALDRRDGEAFRCRNGQRYGIGLLVRQPGIDTAFRTYQGIYPAQDVADPEERAWLCLRPAGEFYACTTHLASTLTSVALRQCGYLLGTVIPGLIAQDGYGPTVIGGDFNLRDRGDPGFDSCAPPPYVRTGDGGLQHILASPDFGLATSRNLDMGRTTDHPGLLAALTRR